MDTDYQIEKRLLELDSGLHNRYRDCVVVSQNMLTRYESTFPTYTDHSALHTLEIIDLCNQLVGKHLTAMTADDLYVLLMGALLHDVGMGISQRDFERFRPMLDLPHLTGPSTDLERAELIRDFHQEFSARYIERYQDLLDIPNPRYVQAIIQVCRGHRKTDLMDEEGYPAQLEVLPGRVVHLPYLAALLCLADELDVAADRNIGFLYDVDKVENPVSRLEFQKHQAIRQVELEQERVVIHAHSDDPAVRDGVIKLADKLGDKLRYCRAVVAARSDFSIAQKSVFLELNAAKEGIPWAF